MRRVVHENPRQIVWPCGSYACLTLVLSLAEFLTSGLAFGYLAAAVLTGTPIIAAMTSYHIRPENSNVRARAALTIVLANAGAVVILLTLASARFPRGWSEGHIASMIGATGVTALGTLGVWLVCIFMFDRIFALVRRFPAQHECRNCGYDLTGNVSGRCPECGTAVGDDKAADANG